jgi:hypothetical protein
MDEEKMFHLMLMLIHKEFVHVEFHQHHLHENVLMIDHFQLFEYNFVRRYLNQILHHYHLNPQHKDESISNKEKKIFTTLINIKLLLLFVQFDFLVL